MHTANAAIHGETNKPLLQAFSDTRVLEGKQGQGSGIHPPLFQLGAVPSPKVLALERVRESILQRSLSSLSVSACSALSAVSNLQDLPQRPRRPQSRFRPDEDGRAEQTCQAEGPEERLGAFAERKTVQGPVKRHRKEKLRSCGGYDVAVLPEGVGNLLLREAEEGAGIPFDLLFQFEEKGDRQVNADQRRIVNQNTSASHAGQLSNKASPTIHVRQEAEGNDDVVTAVGEWQVEKVTCDERDLDGAAGGESGETLSAERAAAQHRHIIVGGGEGDSELGVSAPHIQDSAAPPRAEQF